MYVFPLNHKRQAAVIHLLSLLNLNMFREIFWWDSLNSGTAGALCVWRCQLCAACPGSSPWCPRCLSLLPGTGPWSSVAARGVTAVGCRQDCSGQVQSSAFASMLSHGGGSGLAS